MTKVYVDSCVIIHAIQASDQALAEKAIAEITKEGVEYIYNSIVKLEVLPNPIRNNLQEQIDAYAEWFEFATYAEYTDEINEVAINQIAKHAISLPDATHVATAIYCEADELITAEKPTKGIFQTRDIAVRSIR